MADIKIYGKLKNATESGKVADYADIDGAPEIAQATGQSTEKTMSQKAITDAINAGGSGGSTFVVVTIGDGSSGTLTTDQLTSLQSTLNAVIQSNKEIYYPMDNQHTTGALGYSHLGYENGKYWLKNITITISTRGWVKTTENNLTIDGKSGEFFLGSNLHLDEDTGVLSATNTVTRIGGKTGDINVGSGLNLSEDGTLSATGGGGSGTQTNGYYKYSTDVTLNVPVIGNTYSYDDTKTVYPDECSLFIGQMIIDTSNVIYKVTASSMCECVSIPSEYPIFSIVLPDNLSFPYSGTLTDAQKSLLTSYPVRSRCIDVQIEAGSDESYNYHYLCRSDEIDAQYGAYGSRYWAQYDDTHKLKIVFDYATYQDGTYTIEKVQTYPKPEITSITNFADAYADGFNFNGKTVKFTKIDYDSSASQGYNWRIAFTNGYRIEGYAGGGMSLTAYNPATSTTETIYDTADSLHQTIPVSYEFYDGSSTFGSDGTITGFYASNDSGATYTQLTADQFSAWIQVEFDDLKGGSSNDSALYMHNITFVVDPSKQLNVTVYTTTSEAFTFATFCSKFGYSKDSLGSNTISGCGYFYNGTDMPLLYLSVSAYNNRFNAVYLNGSSVSTQECTSSTFNYVEDSVTKL